MTHSSTSWHVSFRPMFTEGHHQNCSGMLLPIQHQKDCLIPNHWCSVQCRCQPACHQNMHIERYGKHTIDLDDINESTIQQVWTRWGKSEQSQSQSQLKPNLPSNPSSSSVSQLCALAPPHNRECKWRLPPLVKTWELRYVFLFLQLAWNHRNITSELGVHA